MVIIFVICFVVVGATIVIIIINIIVMIKLTHTDKNHANNGKR